MIRIVVVALLASLAVPAEEAGEASAPPLPESSAAQPLQEVQDRALWLQIVHTADGCADAAASPGKCLNAAHWSYRVGEETFALAEPPMEAKAYIPLSEAFTQRVAKIGADTPDKERPPLSTTEVVLYADKRTPARFLVDGFLTCAIAGHVWHLYVACATGLLPLPLPIDRGVMPAVPREGTALEVRVAVLPDPQSGEARFQVERDPVPKAEGLEEALKKSQDRLKERFPSVSFPLIVEAAPAASTQSVADVITASQKVGFDKVQLAVPAR